MSRSYRSGHEAPSTTLQALADAAEVDYTTVRADAKLLFRMLERD